MFAEEPGGKKLAGGLLSRRPKVSEGRNDAVNKRNHSTGPETSDVCEKSETEICKFFSQGAFIVEWKHPFSMGEGSKGECLYD